MAFQVVGVCRSLLSPGRLVTGLEIEIVQLPGVQRRTCPKGVLVLCQKMPDQDGELACRRDSSDVLPAPALNPKKETAQWARDARCGPARLTSMPRACLQPGLVIRPWYAGPGPDYRTLGFSPR